MAGLKKPTIPSKYSYNSVYVNPLTDLKHHHGCSEGDLTTVFTDNKENNPIFGNDKENAIPKSSNANGSLPLVQKPLSNMKSLSTGRVLKPTSLQFCMQMNEPERALKSNLWDSIESEKSASSLNIWDYSDSEAAPASSWSILPNRALLCRALPLDIGRCTCVILKEASPEGLNGGKLYSLYTNEGQGRQDRKLAIAHHERRNGKSVFTIAQNLKGVLSSSDDSFVGNVTANFMGSKYHVWDQGHLKSPSKCNPLQAVVTFMPTIVTCAGSYRSMRVYIHKHQPLQLKNTAQVSGQYELDYSDRGRAGLSIQRSVKNFQLKMEEHGKQTILQLGRVGKSKFLMDFRYPLTGYQAFCICLASIDSKLCCRV
uniref:Tubby C-terminal domain-containing protein n=1 Tax=Manihot esculenta TaxID=3983 RepID=A0A2C9UZ46_MANES